MGSILFKIGKQISITFAKFTGEAFVAVLPVIFTVPCKPEY
jgi:hypothetical protein